MRLLPSALHCPVPVLQALQRMVSQLAAAEPADVDMVRQAEARAAARKERAEAAAAAKAAAEV